MPLFNRPKPAADIRIRVGDLPVLPAGYFTPEQLATWKKAVAALPGRVEVPPMPGDRDANPEAYEAHRRYAMVRQEQDMQAEAEHSRTDPVEIARTNHITRVELTHIERMIGQLEARRAELNARLILGTEEVAPDGR